MKPIVTLAVLAAVLVPVSAYAVTDTSQQQTKPAVTERVEAAKKAAKEKSLQAKADAEARKLVLAETKCTNMKERLVTTVPKLSTSVTSLKEKLDKNYDRIVAVHESGKLDAPDYDTLVAAVEVAKGEAETTIDLIDPSSVTVDCTKSGLGTQLDSYRATVKETKTSLKTYHKALVDLVSTMNASGDKTSESGTDQTDTNTDTEATTDENN